MIDELFYLKSGIPPIVSKNGFLLVIEILNADRELYQRFVEVPVVQDLHRTFVTRPASRFFNAFSNADFVCLGRS